MPATGTALYATCDGTLYDSGGTGNYQDNTDIHITISPSGATSVTLQFLLFDFELNYDYLYIYDGPSMASTIIGQYTGNTLPNGGTIVSSGSSITLRQTSDQNLNYAGFEVNWTCAVGVNETGDDNNEIKLFPNPTSGKFNVQVSNLKVQNLEVYNVLGEKVYSKSLNDKQTSIEINLSDHADGIYFVKLFTDRETIVKKITKE
jgi:hypothetical protein